MLVASTKSPISFLSKLGQTISRKRSPKVSGSSFDELRAQRQGVVLGTMQSGSFSLQDKKEKDLDGAGKRRKTSQSEEVRVVWHLLEQLRRIAIFVLNLSFQTGVARPFHVPLYQAAVGR